MNIFQETQTPVKSRSVCTQTEAPGTADAHLNTELNTADLHPVAEVGGEDGENRFFTL